MTLLGFLKFALIALAALGLIFRKRTRLASNFKIAFRVYDMTSFAVGSSLLATIPPETTLDAQGNPDATFTGVPAWTSSDPAVLTVTANPDGLSAHLTAVKPGTATLTATAVGAEPLSQTASLQVTSGPAVSFQIKITPVVPA